MRWPKKREFIMYYLIFRVFGCKKVNIGNIIDILSPFLSRKNAYRIIKGLKQLGLLRQIDKLTYEVVDLQEYLDRVAASYITQRLIKTIKSSGASITVMKDDDKIIIKGPNVDKFSVLTLIPFMKVDLIRDEELIG